MGEQRAEEHGKEITMRSANYTVDAADRVAADRALRGEMRERAEVGSRVL